MKPIFVGGAQRSGTTMMGSIIGGHSNILCVPEAMFITRFYKGDNCNLREAWEEIVHSVFFVEHWEFTKKENNQIYNNLGKMSHYRDLIEEIISIYAKRANKTQVLFWVCHTPSSIEKSSILLKIFPEAKFIHIYRDGRAVVNSIIKTDFGCNTSYHAAYQWKREVASSFMAEYLVNKPNIFMDIKYEYLIRETQICVENICRYIEVEFESNMLQNKGFIKPATTEKIQRLVGYKPVESRIDSWQNELSKKDIAIIEKHIGSTLVVLGYQLKNYRYVNTSSMKIRTELKEIFGKIRQKKILNKRIIKAIKKDI